MNQVPPLADLSSDARALDAGEPEYRAINLSKVPVVFI